MARLTTLLLFLLLASTASADSYWNHNGSLMRLVDDGGAYRAFFYQSPKASLLATGVRPGTLLFDGERHGDNYSGTARVFSRDCEEPLEYSVEGYVTNGDRRVVLTGEREVYADGCTATGRYTTDTLVFDYQYAD